MWRFGEALRDARKGAGLTQVELAAELGISQALVSSIEQGSRLPMLLLFLRWTAMTKANAGELLSLLVSSEVTV